MADFEWRIVTSCPEKDKQISFFGFARGYKFQKRQDLRDTAKSLPEGIALCSARFVAGPTHVEWVLRQASESWVRDLFLARNRSIDLLMRLTCQRQISIALAASGIDSTSEIILLGLRSKFFSGLSIEQKLTELSAQRYDKILDLDSRKMNFLKSFHSLPEWVTAAQIPFFLLEKSAGLVLA